MAVALAALEGLRGDASLFDATPAAAAESAAFPLPVRGERTCIQSFPLLQTLLSLRGLVKAPAAGAPSAAAGAPVSLSPRSASQRKTEDATTTAAAGSGGVPLTISSQPP